jgi:hypothetical protein
MINTKLKNTIYKEFIRYWIYVGFLTLFFFTFSIYRRLILREYAIDYYSFGFNIFESLILAKIILLGQTLHLGEKYSNKPLIIPTLYKTFIFTLFVLAFTIMETFVMGFLHDQSASTTFQKFLTTGIDEIQARIVIMLFFFSFFFAFLELDRILGGNKLFNFFFKQKDASLKKKDEG